MADVIQESPAAEAAAPMSFTDKLAGIFMSPGEVYENVRRTPTTHGNWLVPTVLVAIVGLIMAFATMNNPSLMDQMKQQAKEAMEKQFQKQIEQGKMTPEQANEARDRAEQFTTPGFMMIGQIAGNVVGPFIGLVVLGLIYWLLGKWGMKADAPYVKVLEVVGLANFIAVLEKIVTLIMQFTMDNIFASPSAGLFVGQLSTMNPWHMFALSMNVFTFWILAVVSVGLSKLFQRDFPKVLVLVIAVWMIWTVAMTFGMSALRG
jgi:hypothetical protein